MSGSVGSIRYFIKELQNGEREVKKKIKKIKKNKSVRTKRGGGILSQPDIPHLSLPLSTSPAHPDPQPPKPSNPWSSARKRGGDGERLPAGNRGAAGDTGAASSTGAGWGDCRKPAATPPARWLSASGGALRRLK